MLMDDEENQVRGYKHVTDTSGVNLAHMSAWSLTDIRILFRWLQNSTPMRHREMCFIGVPSFAFKLFEFALSLLSEKLRRRVSVIFLYLHYYCRFFFIFLFFRFLNISTISRKQSIPKFYRRSAAVPYHLLIWLVCNYIITYLISQSYPDSKLLYNLTSGLNVQIFSVKL